MTAAINIFRGRAYGMDIRVEREADGTLSVYASEAFKDAYTLIANDQPAKILSRFDVTGSLSHWFERQTDLQL